MLRKFHHNIFLGFFLLIIAALYYMNLTNGHNWGDDFSAYIMQAKSIVEGKPLDFVKANRFTIEQSSYPIGPITYPWGFPALLAPIYAIFGPNIIALKSVSIGCFLFFIIVLWITFRKYHSTYWRFLFCCLFAFNPFLIGFLNSILSDIPFLLFSTFCLMFMGAVIVERRVFLSRIFDHILLGVIIAICFFIRTNGVILLVTLGITQCIIFLSTVMFRKSETGGQSEDEKSDLCKIKFKIFGNLYINLLPYFSFGITLLLWSVFLPNGGSGYTSQLNQEVSLGSIFERTYYNIELIADFFTTNIPSKYIIYGATIPLFLSGITRRWRSDFYILIYIALTIILYSVWPSKGQGLRFLFPILPFYFSFVITGLEKMCETRSGIYQLFYKIIYGVPVVVILCYFTYSTLTGVYINVKANQYTDSGPYVEPAKDMFTYITDNSEAASTVIFFKPRAMRMMTGRKSIMINKPEQLSRGDYLCTYNRSEVGSQISINDIKNLIEKRYIELIFKNNDFEIYRLLKSN